MLDIGYFSCSSVLLCSHDGTLPCADACIMMCMLHAGSRLLCEGTGTSLSQGGSGAFARMSFSSSRTCLRPYTSCSTSAHGGKRNMFLHCLNPLDAWCIMARQACFGEEELTNDSNLAGRSCRLTSSSGCRTSIGVTRRKLGTTSAHGRNMRVAHHMQTLGTNASVKQAECNLGCSCKSSLQQHACSCCHRLMSGQNWLSS